MVTVSIYLSQKLNMNYFSRKHQSLVIMSNQVTSAKIDTDTYTSTMKQSTSCPAHPGQVIRLSEPSLQIQIGKTAEWVEITTTSSAKLGSFHGTCFTYL